MNDINFLTRNQNTKPLLAGIVLSLSVSAAMIGALLAQGGGHTTATISDSVSDPRATAPSEGRYPAAPRVPDLLTDTAVSATALGPKGDMVRYTETPTGRLFEVDPETHRIGIISDQKQSGILARTWSPDGQAVVTLFSKTAGTIATYFNFQTGTQTTIGSPISTVIFSPDSRSLAYLEPSADGATLFTSALDGSGKHPVIHTRAGRTQLFWPQQDLMGLSSVNDKNGGTLLLVGLDGSITPLLSNLANLEYVWSPRGAKLLYSYFDSEKGVQLWYRDLVSGALTPLETATSAQKCAWQPDESSVTCGVPTNTTLSRDVPAAHSASTDDIYTINLLTGEQTKEYGTRSEAPISIINPLITSSGSSFVFTNLFDQKLYGFSF